MNGENTIHFLQHILACIPDVPILLLWDRATWHKGLARHFVEAHERLDKESLIDIILELREQMAQMSVRIQNLEDQLAQNSQNSSKPPSSDGLKKKPVPQSLREKGKRKTGGQKGHKGKTLKMVSDPHHPE